jgi:sigma-54 dependent transcriptional regulator, flagellar regulatory protein
MNSWQNSEVKMDNHSHFLVTDDCEHCLYISNAFTLLKLPIKKTSLNELLADPAIISHAISVVLCKKVEKNHHLVLSDILRENTRVLLISFNNDLKTHAPTHFLTMQFSIDELKNKLSQSSNLPEHFMDASDFTDPIFEKLVGKSEQVYKVKAFVKQVADSDATVLILGQSGTGKDVIASCIHNLSNRKNKPLVPINCGAIPSELMESELFGHEKGAFTGAISKRPGRFEMAQGGTLFLDEIGDMPLPMQVKLLRVIQERKIERVGGNASIDVDVRIIAATNKNLEDLIAANQFREDLFYRLNVFPIRIPSLSERAGDLPTIIDYHIDKIYARLHHRVVFTERATEILCNYPWPGNIRELENFLERMVILHRDCVLDEKDLDPLYKNHKIEPLSVNLTINHDVPINIKEHIAKIEQQLIKMALEKSNGIIQVAAEYLSLGRTTLIEKMKKYNLLNSKSTS